MKGFQILYRKVFELFENGQKKCPFLNTPYILWKFARPYHILKLTSGGKKNNFHFVTIFF